MTMTQELELEQKQQPKQGQEQVKAPKGIISKFWNHPVFTMAAVKFGNILDIVYGILSLIFARYLFSAGGLISIVFGILFLLGGLLCVIVGISEFFSRYKKPADKESKEARTELNKKKRNLCIGTAVIVIGLLVVKSTGGGIYPTVRSISFDKFGTETIGELVDANVKGAKWSKEKVDDDSWLVSVEGYCPLYSEDIKIEFFYEKLDDEYREVTLQGVEFPESGEYYNDAFSAGMIWASFYE